VLNKRKLEPTPKVYDRLSTDLLANAKVAPVIVDDPLSRGDKIAVMRSIRDDVLAEMLSRREIDQAQFDAGRKYEALCEQCELGSVQAIDPRKEAVDGGKGYEGITDRQIDAVRHLGEAARILGPKGESMVRFVLISRRPFSALGLSQRATSAARIKFFTYLEILAEFWGCATRARR
jgi:hypothetical protein